MNSSGREFHLEPSIFGLKEVDSLGDICSSQLQKGKRKFDQEMNIFGRCFPHGGLHICSLEDSFNSRILVWPLSTYSFNQHKSLFQKNISSPSLLRFITSLSLEVGRIYLREIFLKLFIML